MKGENMKQIKFYRCRNCGNVVIKMVDSKVPVVCCGEPMDEIRPNKTDAAQEKHVPVVERNENILEVTVGEVLHPMTKEHLITNIVLLTDLGYYVRVLKAGDEPKAKFNLLEGENPIEVFAYCNLHSMWAK